MCTYTCLYTFTCTCIRVCLYISTNLCERFVNVHTHCPTIRTYKNAIPFLINVGNKKFTSNRQITTHITSLSFHFSTFLHIFWELVIKEYSYIHMCAEAMKKCTPGSSKSVSSGQWAHLLAKQGPSSLASERIVPNCAQPTHPPPPASHPFFSHRTGYKINEHIYTCIKKIKKNKKIYIWGGVFASCIHRCAPAVPPPPTFTHDAATNASEWLSTNACCRMSQFIPTSAPACDLTHPDCHRTQPLTPLPHPVFQKMNWIRKGLPR